MKYIRATCHCSLTLFFFFFSCLLRERCRRVRQLGLRQTPAISTPKQNMLLLHSATELVERPQVRYALTFAVTRAGEGGGATQCFFVVFFVLFLQSAASFSIDEAGSRFSLVCSFTAAYVDIDVDTCNTKYYDAGFDSISYDHVFRFVFSAFSWHFPAQLIPRFMKKAYCKGYGTMYVTDDLFDEGNPWDDPPTFLSAMLDAAKTKPSVEECQIDGLKVLAPLLGSDPAGK